uniref:hypothetical protein n=1 Tax=Castellaniella defragrans TaxID=75697 RepID=UPI00333FC2DE
MIDDDGEVYELTAEDLKQFGPVAEVLPSGLQAKIGMRRRGPQKDPTKLFRGFLDGERFHVPLSRLRFAMILISGLF